jgi:hypothetical protein
VTVSGNPAFKQEMATTFHLIQKVHGHTLTQKPIPLVKARSRRARPGPSGSAPEGRVDIRIHTDTGQKKTALHEIGHMLDFGAGGGGTGAGYFLTYRTVAAQKAGKTPPSPAMAKLMDAMRKSDAITHLTKTTAKGKQRTYLLDPAEQFARAYAQYIATRTKDKNMMDGTQSKFKTFDGGLIQPKNFYPTTWRHSDFKEIAAAFDLLLKELGWA